MNFIESFVVKLIGKRLDNQLEKWHISKTKVISWLGAIVAIVPPISVAVGHPIVIPPSVFEFLGALGLWALKDGQTPPVTPAP